MREVEDHVGLERRDVLAHPQGAVASLRIGRQLELREIQLGDRVVRLRPRGDRRQEAVQARQPGRTIGRIETFKKAICAITC